MGPRNDVSGVVHGPSVQAVDIHGGVHFHSPSPPLVTVPRQTAPPNPRFAGRAGALRSMHRAARRPGPGLIVLTGVGGVGKTALARKWAHEVASSFPDGQLYLDLGGFGPGPPMDPAEALRSFLRSLGAPAADLPAGPAALAGLYRSRTADRSMLVVLDNAFSAAQARVLLPSSPASVTVVTSRNRLSGLVGDGATHLQIGPLSDAESMALLAEVVGATRVDGEREQAARLVELCAGLPLALTLAAARLATRPRLPLERVVAALAGEPDRLGRLRAPDEEASVRGSFALSYRALAADAAALFRRLSLHPGAEFGRGPVVALTADADRLIETLVEANLVQDNAGERYQLHDLIRLYARERAQADDTEADRDAALLAVLEWYLGAASAADLAVTPYRRRLPYAYRTSPAELPEFAGRGPALEWLERERANLRLAGQAALDRGWAALAWQLCDVMWPLQLYRKGGDRREIDARGLAAAELLGDPRALGRMAKRLGRTCTTLGERDLAEQHLRAAVAYYTEAGDVAGRVEAEEMLALAYRDAGRPDLALRSLRAVLVAWRELGDVRHTGLTLIELGLLASRAGRPAEAIEQLAEAGRLLAASVAADPYNPIRVTIGLAGAHLENGDLSAADRLAGDAIRGMRALGNAAGEADALELAGRIAERGGDPARGRRLRQAAREVREGRGLPAPPGVQDAGQGLDTERGVDREGHDATRCSSNPTSR